MNKTKKTSYRYLKLTEQSQQVSKNYQYKKRMLRFIKKAFQSHSTSSWLVQCGHINSWCLRQVIVQVSIIGIIMKY